MSSPLFWIGLILTGLVALAVFFGGKMMTPASVEVPVALGDIPPGTQISPALFRLEKWTGVQGRTLAEYVTKDEFGPYIGAVTVETVHAGFPLGKAQVMQPGEGNARIQRLTLMLQSQEGGRKVVFPLPVDADTAGNYLQAGDYVDLVFSVGAVNVREMDDPPDPTPTPPAIAGAGLGFQQPTPTPRPLMTETFRLPLSKLVIQNVPVLRVEREIVRNNAPSVSIGLGGGAQQAGQPSVSYGDVQRLYVALDQEQVEIISFILHNGDVRVAAHATVYPEEPTEGVTWDDFEDWFFQQRGLLHPTPTPQALVPGLPTQPTQPAQPVQPAPTPAAPGGAAPPGAFPAPAATVTGTGP
jgi:Flp pilus assembly protein CpaB